MHLSLASTVIGFLIIYLTSAKKRFKVAIETQKDPNKFISVTKQIIKNLKCKMIGFFITNIIIIGLFWCLGLKGALFRLFSAFSSKWYTLYSSLWLGISDLNAKYHASTLWAHISYKYGFSVIYIYSKIVLGSFSL